MREECKKRSDRVHHVSGSQCGGGGGYLGAFAQVAADLHVAVVGRRQLLQHLLPLVGLAVGLLQAAELLVGGLWGSAGGRGGLVPKINSLKVGLSQCYSCTRCVSLLSVRPR